MRAAHALFAVLRWSGVPWLLREAVQRRRVTILCYHHPRAQRLDEHLTALAARYRFIPLREYVRARLTGNWRRIPHKALVITLDDGHRSNAHLRDVFTRHGVQPTIFVCSDIVATRRHFWWTKLPDSRRRALAKRVPDDERLRWLEECGFREDTEYAEPQALSRAEIDALRAVVDFQSHTRFHPILPSCEATRARSEIQGSKERLESEFALSVYALAYPNGDYTAREAEMARSADYACALGVAGGYNDEHTDLFRLRRIAVNDEADVSELLVKASGLWPRLDRLAVGRRPSRGGRSFARPVAGQG